MKRRNFTKKFCDTSYGKYDIILCGYLRYKGKDSYCRKHDLLLNNDQKTSRPLRCSECLDAEKLHPEQFLTEIK